MFLIYFKVADAVVASFILVLDFILYWLLTQYVNVSFELIALPSTVDIVIIHDQRSALILHKCYSEISKLTGSLNIKINFYYKDTYTF